MIGKRPILAPGSRVLLWNDMRQYRYHRWAGLLRDQAGVFSRNTSWGLPLYMVFVNRSQTRRATPATLDQFMPRHRVASDLHSALHVNRVAWEPVVTYQRNPRYEFREFC
jgi:hypothetical protein